MAGASEENQVPMAEWVKYKRWQIKFLFNRKHTGVPQLKSCQQEAEVGGSHRVLSQARTLLNAVSKQAKTAN